MALFLNHPVPEDTYHLVNRLDASTARRLEAPPVADRLDFNQVFAEHAPFIRRTVLHLAGPHLEPDDLVQEVLVQVFRNLPGFRGDASLRSWVYGVTLRVVSNARRRSRFRRFLGLEHAPDPIAAESSSAGAEQHEAHARVQLLLERLSERKRTVLVLFELEGLSGPEIAEILGCPLATVKTRLHHARQEFLRQLQLEEGREHERANLRNRTKP